MATHSGILAWEIPWTEEPGGLQSIGLKKKNIYLFLKMEKMNSLFIGC